MAVVVLGAVAFLLFKGLSSSIVYFRTANQAVADRAQLAGQSFRIEGTVVPGTVVQRDQTVDFSIESAGAKVSVVNRGSPPQLFAADRPVVLQGHFQGGGNTFMSDQIMVKHSASYVAAHPGRVRAPDGTTR